MIFSGFMILIIIIVFVVIVIVVRRKRDFVLSRGCLVGS